MDDKYNDFSVKSGNYVDLTGNDMDKNEVSIMLHVGEWFLDKKSGARNGA